MLPGLTNAPFVSPTLKDRRNPIQRLADQLTNQSDTAQGAGMVGYADPRAPAYLKTLSDIINGVDISLLRFIHRAQHTAILDGSSTYDVAAKFQEAIDALSTGQDTITGGTLRLHRGKWNLSTKVSVRTGHVDALTSLNIRGDGLHNTYLYALPGFVGSSVLELLEPTYCTVEGLHLFVTGRANIGLDTQAGSEITLRDVLVQGAVVDGFKFTNNFMLTLERLRSKSNAQGFNFAGPHTSIAGRALYALNNTGAGFKLADALYSHFEACGSDTNLIGYQVLSAKGLKFTGCGAEDCARAGFHFEASAAHDATTANCDGIRATLEECYATGCDTAAGGYGGSIYANQADTSSIDVSVRGFREQASASALSVVTSGSSNHVVRLDEACQFTQATNGPAVRKVRTGSATYDPPSLADGAGVTTTVSVPGVAFGDHVTVGFGGNLQGITVTGYVSATDTVSVRFQNETGGALDLASGTLSVRCTPAS